MPVASYRPVQTAGMSARTGIEDLSRVVLCRDVVSEGRRLPAGSAGTVVGVYRNGAAYEVEFTTPFHTVATVDAAAIQR